MISVSGIFFEQSQEGYQDAIRVFFWGRHERHDELSALEVGARSYIQNIVRCSDGRASKHGVCSGQFIALYFRQCSPNDTSQVC